MNYAVIGDLVRRATDSADDVTVKFKDGVLAESMARVAASRKQSQNADLDAINTELLRASEDQKIRCRAVLRNARRVERTQKKKMAAIDNAWKYAAETGNLAPLIYALGIDWGPTGLTFEEYTVARKIPSDWKPTADEGTG